MSLLNSSEKRKLRVRSKVNKNNRGQRPRIVTFRSNKNIYAQLISIDGNVICSNSSLLLDQKILKDLSGIDIASRVGSDFAKICIEKGVLEVVFDKGSYLYGGRIKALAESCREAGLKF